MRQRTAHMLHVYERHSERQQIAANEFENDKGYKKKEKDTKRQQQQCSGINKIITIAIIKTFQQVSGKLAAEKLLNFDKYENIYTCCTVAHSSAI